MEAATATLESVPTVEATTCAEDSPMEGIISVLDSAPTEETRAEALDSLIVLAAFTRLRLAADRYFSQQEQLRQKIDRMRQEMREIIARAQRLEEGVQELIVLSDHLHDLVSAVISIPGTELLERLCHRPNLVDTSSAVVEEVDDE